MNEPQNLEALEAEVAGMIIEALSLGDVNVADIDPTTPLFNEGLGLDSVDALELAIAIHKKYAIKVSSDDPAVRDAFQSLRSLTTYIAERRAEQK